MQLYLKNFKYSIFLSLLLIPLYYFFLYSNMWNIFKAQTIFGDLKLNILWLKCNYEGFKVFEDNWALAFYDISPQAPIHILVVPKGRYVSMEDFSGNASDPEIAGYFRAVGVVARQTGAVSDGYRLLANHGKNAHQEVPHFHIHILGGEKIGLRV